MCMLAQPGAADLMAAARIASKHFRKSLPARTEFERLQRMHGRECAVTLPKDVATRWTSSYHLLQRVLDLKDELLEFSINSEVVRFDPGQWILAQELVDILKVCAQVTDIFQATKQVSLSCDQAFFDFPQFFYAFSSSYPVGLWPSSLA